MNSACIAARYPLSTARPAPSATPGRRIPYLDASWGYKKTRASQGVLMYAHDNNTTAQVITRSDPLSCKWHTSIQISGPPFLSCSNMLGIDVKQNLQQILGESTCQCQALSLVKVRFVCCKQSSHFSSLEE
eukprot:575675-Hanusia_phi.AAC.2